MPATTTRRSLFVTVFGVVGTCWFALHAIEYLYVHFAALDAMMPLPSPLGISGLYEVMPQWASMALTVTIWLGLLGAFLLLLGDRASVLLLSLTLIASIVSLMWGGLAVVEGLGSVGQIDPLMFVAAQTTVSLGIWLYARTAKRFGTL